MEETPIVQDPTVLNRLYKRFNYLQDLPCEPRGCFIDDAVNLGTIESDSFLGFLMAYEIEEQRPMRDHFAFLSVEENLKINRYRHIRPVEPWPQPIIGIAFSRDGNGRTTGTHRVDVMLNPVGEAQLWWGSDVGVIWEAFLSDRIQELPEFEPLMNQLWQHCEQFLKAQGVEQIFTDAYDPEFADQGDWYPNFLRGRGYQVHEQGRTQRKVLRKTL